MLHAALAIAALATTLVLADKPARGRLQGFDALAPRGRAVILEAKLERASGFLGVHPDVHGVEVAFEAGGATIGRARTGRDGLARVAWTPTSGIDEHAITVRVEGGRRWVADPAPLRVFARDPARPVLVVDLDGTVCESSEFDVATRPPSEIAACDGAAAALGRLAARFDVVYLTARDDAFSARSREWLDLRGFPRGPVLVRDVGPRTLSAEAYKAERLLDLARDFRLAAGVGDRDEDARAYLAAGLAAIVVGGDGTRGIPARARHARDWAAVEKLLADSAAK